MQVPHGCRNAVWEVKSRCVVHSQVLYESGQRERVCKMMRLKVPWERQKDSACDQSWLHARMSQIRSKQWDVATLR